MNSKERHDFMTTNLPKVYKRTAEEIVQDLANILIDALYIPVKGDSKTSPDNDRILHFSINRNEPINWGDLKCCDVKEFKDGSLLVTIDEASPDACPTLCRYIYDYLKSYGWETRVETEW